MLLTSVFVAVLFLNRSVLLRRGLARIIFWQAIADFLCTILLTIRWPGFKSSAGCVLTVWSFPPIIFSNAWLLVLVAHLYLQASSRWVQAENADIYYHGFAWGSTLLAFLLYFHEQVLLLVGMNGRMGVGVDGGWVGASFSPANYFVTGMGF